MKKVMMVISYILIIITLFLIGFFTSNINKFYYGLVGAFIGVILSLILWSTLGDMIIKQKHKEKLKKLKEYY